MKKAKTPPTVTQSAHAARTFRQANPAVPTVKNLPSFSNAFERYGIALEQFARTPEDTPEADAACDSVDAAQSALVAIIDDLIPSPYLTVEFPSAARTVGLLETLDAYVMTAIVQQSTEEESAEGKAAEDLAMNAHGDLYAFLDVMLHAAFSNGFLHGQAFTTAELADCPQVALRNANKLLH